MILNKFLLVDFYKGDIMSITLVPKVKGYQQQCVEQLQELLSMAEHGQIKEVVVIYKTDVGYDHNWTGCDNMIELLGVLDRLKHLQHLRIDEIIGEC